MIDYVSAKLRPESISYLGLHVATKTLESWRFTFATKIAERN